jgi:hypothetical protein
MTHTPASIFYGESFDSFATDTPHQFGLLRMLISWRPVRDSPPCRNARSFIWGRASSVAVVNSCTLVRLSHAIGRRARRGSPG